MLLEAIVFISQPLGGWLHTLVVAAALQLAAGLSLRHWRALSRIPSTRTATTSLRQVFGRLALLAGALLAARLLMAVLLLLPANSLHALRVLPPLERALGLAGSILLVWAIAFPAAQRRADLAAAGLCLGTWMGLMLTWRAWTPAMAVAAFYNGSRTETLWTVASVAVLGGGLWLVATARPRSWLPATAALGVFLAGQVLHYLYPVAGLDAPGAVRWAEMAGYPLAMLVLYRRALAWPLGAQALREAEAAAQMLAERQAAARKPRPAVVQLLEVLLFAGIFFFAIEYATGRFRVDGPSMQPTLHTGQYVLTDKLVYRFDQPRRGDVVVVRILPGGGAGRPRELIKRVVGLPGETLTIEDGLVSIDGWPYPELYLMEAPAYSGTWTLGPGEYFVLGDNRNDSSDSHVWGPISRDRFLGKALIVYWPPQEWVVVAHAQGR
jgi:signal peptidase I